MRNNHQYFLDMCSRVKRFYRKNEEFLDRVEGVTQSIVRLNQLTDELSLEFENSIAYFQGYSIINARKRENLQNQCIKFSDHIREIQRNIKYNTAKGITHFQHLNQIEMNTLDDEELINYASGLYDLSTGMESRFKMIGVYQKAFETFAKYLTLFALDYPVNQYTVEKRKSGNLQSLRIIAMITELLDNKLDSIIETISVNGKGLYEDYLAARDMTEPDLNRKPHFEGEINGGEVINLAELNYDKDREYLVTVDGGNAIWGLSNYPKKIEYGRPVYEREQLRVSSRIIAPEGKYLSIQAVNPGNPVRFKIWLS